MDPVLDRIEVWERDGLIDALTAGRLRAAEAGRGDGDAAGTDLAGSNGVQEAVPEMTLAGAGRMSVGSVFGPGVMIAEMFAYLGGGFLLAAWSAFVIRVAGAGADTQRFGVGGLITAAGLVVIGLVLGATDRRRRRAAGVVFLVALGYIAVSLAAFLTTWFTDPLVFALLVTSGTLAAAAIFRRLLPALLTSVGLLASITGFGWAVLEIAASLIAPRPFDGFANPDEPPSELALIVVAAVGWLVVALVLGFLAIAEDRAAPDPADDPERCDDAHRRSTLIRAWAGLVAVWGLASAVTRSSFAADFATARVIPAWLGDAAILVLAIILVERAFRRDSGAFLFAAGIGFVTALTDFNFSYLADSRELGLLVEGGILFGVGLLADRLRRGMPGGRMDRPGSPSAVTGSIDPGPAEVDRIGAANL